MAEKRYVDEGKKEGNAYLISLYEGSAWLMTYKGYISRYCNLEMKLYPHQVGTGVSSEAVPGKHSISIFKIENYSKWKRS